MRRPAALVVALSLLMGGAPAARDTRIAGWFDLPVRGGEATLALFGIPPDERAWTLPLLARASFERGTRIGLSISRVNELLSAATTPALGEATDSDVITVPAPLDAAVWRDLLQLDSSDDLFAVFLTNRAAILLAVGLMATDDSIRDLVVRDRDLLQFVYRSAAATFTLAARSLRIERGQIVVPGGEDGARVWETLVGAPPSRPAAFLRALLSKDQGRLAWYFDAVAGLEPGRLEAAWPGVGGARIESASALYEVFRNSDPQWKAAEQPFRRNVADAWTIVTQTAVVDGRLRGPTSSDLWKLLFDAEFVDAAQASRVSGPSTAITIPDLARGIVVAGVRERRLRYEMFRLAQRVFDDGDAPQQARVGAALGGFKRYRGLLLALERMGIVNPETWATAVRAAHHVSQDADDKREALAIFQGLLAIVERTRHVRSIDAATADRLVRSLASAVSADSNVVSPVVCWVIESLVPALPPLERPDALTGRTAYESRILQALAGPLNDPKPSLDWEGLTYRIDIASAELDRIRAIRQQLPSPGFDGALVKQHPRELADAITAIVYATALGDPEGAALLSRDVAARHDFGFGSTALRRAVTSWAPPEERQGLGPWHVEGALLSLDLGLSRLALRRVADQNMPPAPTLTLNDFGTLTRTIVAMVPSELRDADRDAIAAAIARGRQRLRNAGLDVTALDSLAREAQISATSRRLLPWVVSRQPEVVAHVFSMRDLLWLGKPELPPTVLDAWGLSGSGLDGRHTTVMSRPGPWEDFAGRPDAGQVATQLPDLTLRIIEEMAHLRLPAMLTPSMLAFAVEDFWHDVQARFADDWPRMARQAAAIKRERVEDYVAALAGGGPLRAQ